MKITILASAISIMTVGVAAQSYQDIRHRIGHPCVDVKIQAQSYNQAKTQQTCDYNLSGTIQTGAENQAITRQSGRFNYNHTRQYDKDIGQNQMFTDNP